ncbi:MAG: IS200/IS605 family accessory protein TnpB-related protein [Candidatus Dormibacteria bacterium]
MSSRVRHRIGPVVRAPAVTTLRIRTRLPVSDADQAVIVALGTHLGRLARADLAKRSRAGLDHSEKVWAQRKRAVTKESSSRWAGAITKASNDAYATARRNQLRQRADLTRAIATLEEKIELSCHSAKERGELRAMRAGRKLKFGYCSELELAMKRQRLQHLRARRARLDQELDAGRVHITRGGKCLLRHRLHLDQAGITKEQWRALWDASRWWITANGESGKHFGNETIRLSPEGVLEVDLPQPLAQMANVTMGGLTRYRFQAAVHFSYRQAEWLAQVRGDRAIAYSISFDPAKDRFYLDASFTPASPAPVPAFQELLLDRATRTLAVDHNHGFLAPALLDRSGNPVGRLSHIPLLTEDLSAPTRDGHLRQAITQLLDLAEVSRARCITIEDLGFSEMRSTGRERYGSRHWFRKVVSGMPTARFRDRLVAMASRRGIAVVGVPAAYTSIWGRQHWLAPLLAQHQQVSGHTAAAVVLGRRAFGHSARRRPQASPGVTTSERRIEAAGQPADVESYSVGSVDMAGTGCEDQSKPRRRKGSHTSGARPETATATLAASRSGKTARPDRVLLMGTQEERSHLPRESALRRLAGHRTRAGRHLPG